MSRDNQCAENCCNEIFDTVTTNDLRFGKTAKHFFLFATKF